MAEPEPVEPTAEAADAREERIEKMEMEDEPAQEYTDEERAKS